MKKKYSCMVAAVAVSMLLGACTGKVTGGGTIPSSSGVQGQKANFGFNVDACDVLLLPQSHITFHDKDAPAFQPGGIKLQAKVVLVLHGTLGSEAGSANPYVLQIGYESTNPKFPGTGAGAILVVDSGEGAAAFPDVASISLTSGPYAGAVISGDVRGNVQSHACK